MNIKFINNKTAKMSAVVAAFCISFITASGNTIAAKTGTLSNSYTDMFAQNNITFYDPSDCISGVDNSGICGDTTKEKIWSALRQYFDVVHTAAAFGNIAGEGGFNPVRWQYGNGVPSATDCSRFVTPWDTLYNDASNAARVGVGDFAITSGLSTYLHYINDNEPDLLEKYFKDPSYTCLNGDDLISAIGENDFNRLVALEVKYFLEEWLAQSKKEAFEAISGVGEAAKYYAHNIMVCAACGYNQGDSELYKRAAAAEKYYDEMGDFSCSSSSSSSWNSTTSPGVFKNVSGDQVTWIGDSYTGIAGKSMLESKLPGVDYGPAFNDQSCNSYVDSGKFADHDAPCNSGGTSGISIAKSIISSGNMRPYLVFALGTNSSGADKFKQVLEDLDAALDSGSPDTKVLLMTAWTLNSEYTDQNAIIRKWVDEHPDRYFLADWNKEVAGNANGYYGCGDNIHPGCNNGYSAFLDFMISALNAIGDDGCTTYTGDYPEYRQCDPNWGSLSYGESGDTICNSGCGAASMAMLATVATGQDIFPNDIADLLGDKYDWNTSVLTNDPIVGKHYGFEVVTESFSTISEAETKMREYLQKGYMIHMTGAGCYPGFQSGSNCSEGHLIGIYNIDANDNVLLANSAYDGNQTYPLSEVVKAIKHGVFTAIKSGKNKSSCSGLCSVKNATAIQGGLAEAEAQRLADYYNSSAVTASSFPGGAIPAGTKTNCVSFSTWFIYAFTDAKEGTYGGNGKDVAINLSSQGGFESGSAPRPFAVFGVPTGSTMCGGTPCGHTGIVVAVDGDQITTVEAGYNSYDAKIVVRDISYFTSSTSTPFTYTDGHIDLTKLNQIVSK